MAQKYLVFCLLVATAFLHAGNCHLRLSEIDTIDYVSPDLDPVEEEEFEKSISESVDVTSYALEEESDCENVKGNTDDYVDKLLAEVEPHISKPFSLPARKGRFRLFNGLLFGLGSLRRTGPAMVRCTEDTFSFHVPVSLTNLTGNYFWEFATSFRPFNGTIDMSLDGVEGDILYTRRFDSEGKVSKAEVEKVTITRLEGPQVEFTGLGPLSRIASRFTSFVARAFRRGIARSLEGPVRDLINRELRNVEKYEEYYY